MMLVVFLPVIPKPITERANVRHCLTNFQSVRRQLNQESMAIWCDEGVFAPAADIYLEETNKFKDLFLGFAGPFHWTCVLLRCQGNLLRGCGPDDALIECAVFGPGVIESVLNGSHYVRALTGMLIVEDMIKSLQWQMFWHDKEKAAYPVLTQLRALCCQDRPGWFCALGGDMKVEQTIQRVSKDPGGHYVAGATRNASAVAEFKLLFHEIGSITNLLKFLTTNHPMNHT